MAHLPHFATLHAVHTSARPSETQRAVATAGALVLRALFATLRLEVRDPHGFLRNPPPQPVIFTFWHNRILAITAAFLRHYPATRGGVLVLTSPSRDGMWLDEVARRLGMGAIRGSSSRRGATAMRELLEKVEAGHDIAITPDGPRGPRYTLGPGPVFLSQKAGIPLIPVHARFHRAARLNTWDRFAIPLPFSRVEVTIDRPHLVAETGEDAAFEAERTKIESVLRAGTDYPEA